MKKKNRDDFTERTKLQIAKRAGWLCSYPSCRTPTIGATSDGKGEINIGTAAHICAAAPGGPRYDSEMSPEDRSAADNGIWMCRDHGKAIDSDDPEFTVERLREWKRQAEQYSWRRVLRNEALRLPAAATDPELAQRLRDAAKADLAVFQRTAKWPPTSVALALQVDGKEEPATTCALASAVTAFDNLVLAAPPGMGKTTTLFQIAEGVLAGDSGTPLFVSLGDWATEELSIPDSILRRPAFRGLSKGDFQAVAAEPGVVLLLDGWNELGSAARQRARVQVEMLKAELPHLALVVSTRKQVLDVPFVGTRADLLPLSEVQQLKIATAMRGEAGAKTLDLAWRTAGIRELVTIPLYLTTLLSLPEKAPFPRTKEEVLRRFVNAHEEDARRAGALREVSSGLHQAYLDNLADFATRTESTTISDNNARRSVSETEAMLLERGQISVKPQPDTILDALVSNHVLMRSGDIHGYSFQHQQFQEWYASHAVERRIILGIDDPLALGALKLEILNQPTWEEAIFFSIERLTRGSQHQRAACGKAILAALDVDPLLAAEMIFRSTEEVWMLVSEAVQAFVNRWHAPGEVDRALRFMLTTGRPEFLDAIWPLITHQDEQVSLKALQNCKQLRPSILGQGSVMKIKALPTAVRSNLLHEFAFRGGVDGLELATLVAKHDPDTEVKIVVIDALASRYADKHVDEILRNADENVFDTVVRKKTVDQSDDDLVKAGLAAAHERQAVEGVSTYGRLSAIVYANDAEDLSAELTSIISEMEIKKLNDAKVHLIYEARNRHPDAVARGILARVRADKSLFYAADDILVSAGLNLEDESLLELSLAGTKRHDSRAEAAASVLGPEAAGRMIDEWFEVGSRLRPAGKYDEAAGEVYGVLQDRIAHVSGESLVAAVCARSAGADNEQMACLANLLSRHPNHSERRGRPFNSDSLETIQRLAQNWGDRMLASGDAKRWQTASIAPLVGVAPSKDLLPLLERLLNDELRRFRAFREEAKVTGWRHGDAVDEARTLHASKYQHAFLAIKAPETTSLMREYLADEHFGELAAQVLVGQWRAANEPSNNKRFFGGVDFSRVQQKRAARAANPDETSAEAESIFTAIEPLIKDDATAEQKKLGIALGIVGARLPHGQRDSTIQKIIALSPRRPRADLLLNLVLSGEELDVNVVADGIAETLEAAKEETWILTQSDGYELKLWLRLLPFVNHPTETLAVLRNMPMPQRDPRFLEGMVRAFANAEPIKAEEVLFRLAEEDPRFYLNYCWCETVLQIGTLSSARRVIDLAAKGVLRGKDISDWHLAQELGRLIGEHPEMRTYVYDLLKIRPIKSKLTLLADTIAENPDEEGLLLLVELENEMKRSFLGLRAIERVVAQHVPIEKRQNAYNIVPVPCAELRRKLLSMTSGDDAATDAAARCLNEIDRIRDDYGNPIGEPRHPDLASGKPWPVIAIGSSTI